MCLEKERERERDDRNKNALEKQLLSIHFEWCRLRFAKWLRPFSHLLPNSTWFHIVFDVIYFYTFHNWQWNWNNLIKFHYLGQRNEDKTFQSNDVIKMIIFHIFQHVFPLRELGDIFYGIWKKTGKERFNKVINMNRREKENL